MTLTPQEAENRQDLFVSHARERGQVWVLMRDEGFANFSDDDSTVIPAWASRDEAAGCAMSSFPGYKPHMIPTAEFAEVVLRALAANEAWIAVAPTSDLGGNQLPAGRLAEILCGTGV